MTQDNPLFKINLGLIVVLWITSTQIYDPIRKRLRASKDDEAIMNLCKTNWFKTFGWTIKSIILLSV